MKPLPPSVELYQSFLQRAPEILSRVLNRPQPQFQSALLMCSKARRIFFTASGSSITAAWYAARFLSTYSCTASCFVSTSELLSLQSLNREDCVVLVSQGFNRSDARIVVQYASKCGTPILVITAAQAAEYTQLSFEPTAQDERLFCRPVGAITGYVVAARLAHELCSQPFPSISLFLDALRDGLTFGELQKASAIASLNEAETVIVLASGAAQPAAHNVALALREGANKNAVFYEIEYYAHGQYAPHLNAFKKGHAISYVVVSNEQDPVSEAAVQRITPLLTNVGASVMWVSSTRTKPEAVVDILAKGASLVERLLLNSSYDMNSPVGKEENRSFHEVDETFYERCKQR